MRAVVQRVKEARVRIDGETVGEIAAGLLVLLGVGTDDTEADARYLAEKIAHLRILPDEAGKMNRSVLETGAAVLAVSQFTLYGDARGGRRPSYVRAAPPQIAQPLYERFVDELRELGVPTETGRF
ncbi:MAG TPA: D-aminoacyl-tRNA deacylase, partial [Limnochordia bacterium]